MPPKARTILAWSEFLFYGISFQRARDMRTSAPTALSARFDRKSRRIVIRLSSQLDVSFPPRIAQGLEHATPAALRDIEISPSGFGIPETGR